MTQALKGILEQKLAGAMFGDTPTGADWCVKALHPSDPLTEVRGVPDHSAVPTVCMNYQSTFTLRTSGTSTWAFDMSILPHPYYFAYWSGNDGNVVCPESGINIEGNMWNTQLIQGGGQPASDALLNAWLGVAQRWRLAYAGCTIYQDGPDLANQGTIVVAQTPVVSQLTTSSQTIGTTAFSSVPLKYYSKAIMGPAFARSQNMPSAMLGRSRDGAYVPLKLTDTCQDWFGPETVIGVLSGLSVMPNSAVVQIPNTYLPNYPFPSVQSTVLKPSDGTFSGDALVDLVSTNVAQVSARNLSPQTSYTFYFRYGIEMQMAPSSALTPQLKLSPPYDPRALNTYFMLSREMKDAYPADYNDLGKMWDVISGAIKTVAPALNLAVPGLGALGKGVAMFGDSVRARRRGNPLFAPLRPVAAAPQRPALPTRSERAAMLQMVRDNPQGAREAAVQATNLVPLARRPRRRRQPPRRRGPVRRT